jgi:hypothetical protein
MQHKIVTSTQQKKNNALQKRFNGPTTKETYRKEININTTTTDYMKHTRAAEDYANRHHKEIEDAFTKFNRATYFNLNFKIETSSAVNSLA